MVVGTQAGWLHCCCADVLTRCQCVCAVRTQVQDANLAPCKQWRTTRISFQWCLGGKGCSVAALHTAARRVRIVAATAVVRCAGRTAVTAAERCLMALGGAAAADTTFFKHPTVHHAHLCALQARAARFPLAILWQSSVAMSCVRLARPQRHETYLPVSIVVM